MIAKIFIPKLGMTMEKATVAEWLYRDGDDVEQGSSVLVIDTEKTANEIEASIGGKLVIDAEVGVELPCGAIVGYIAETQEEYDAAKGGGTSSSIASQTVVDLSTVVAPSTDAQPPAQPIPASYSAPVPAPGERIRISPLARTVAKQNQFDYLGLSGSGPGGRIVKKDIEAALQSRQVAQHPVTVAACPGSRGCTGGVAELPVASVVVSGGSAQHHEGKRVREVVPLRGVRKAISEHMQRSHSVSAPVTTFSEVDMTETIKLRNRLVEKNRRSPVKITYTDLFILMIARVLKQVPIMNSSLIGNDIILWDDINIGFAVSVTSPEGESSLVVPVIRNADKLSLGEISKYRSALTENARNGNLAIDEMAGGTFTITNTATLIPMWHLQTPIINQPQAAILGTSGIVERPVVRDGEIVVRPVMPLSLTFDHRIIDGGPSGNFVNLLHEMIEDPELMFL